MTLDSSLKGQARDKEEELKMDPPDICELQEVGPQAFSTEDRQEVALLAFCVTRA